MKYNILLTMILFVASSSGCAKSIPSDEDAKKAIANLIGDCKYLTIENFRRINGMEKDENTYVVSVEYSIHVTPLPEIKEIIQDQSQILSDIEERLKNAHSQMVAAAEETKVLFDKNEVTGERWTAANEKHHKFVELQESIEKEKSNFKKNIINHAEKFSKECPSLNPMLYAQIYNNDDLMQYAQEYTKQFGGDLTMMNTENGWIPSN